MCNTFLWDDETTGWETNMVFLFDTTAISVLQEPTQENY